jgi:hypothetical protein
MSNSSQIDRNEEEEGEEESEEVCFLLKQHYFSYTKQFY